MKRLLFVFFLMFFPVLASASDVSGTGWVSENEHGDKVIYLLERDGTFSKMAVEMPSVPQMTGQIQGDDLDTYRVSNNQVVLSHGNGFMICNLTLNNQKNRMSGECITRDPFSDDVVMKLIE